MAAGMVRSSTLDGALRPRLVGLAETPAGPAWLTALIEYGHATFGDETRPVTGPALAWRPWWRGARARFEAGTVGAYVLLGPTALAAAVGHMPESRDLREMVDHPVTCPLDRTGETLSSMRAAFSGVRREILAQEPAAHAVVEAHLRVILIEAYRVRGSLPSIEQPSSPSHRIFARYSAMIERNFRDRWTVEKYADALGTSRDRLGDVCRRVRGIGAKDLIDRRVVLEARLQLENSSNSIEQVAGLLGFASAAQFNKFFRRRVGQPPGAYRAHMRTNRAARSEDDRSLYDWP
ncbi:AraC family transcriptional regulator [Psychromarinibacter sp. C21-152]|uniref:AraC family transcriptional regulator n=1 Tax=Psychromarinibacter sediminicola TaxID=3033385 RepID=A0AAE3TAH3_9RHOB|nr:AraC family transcriptional regulator [Psychromarinibacter sediminicola]MDF0602858.1 AraC family transcriptional regulator [Psychromarinibacter sediminicola]